MPVSKIKIYSDIPNCPKYLVSNFGDVIKKKTWKFMAVKNGLVTITVMNKRKLLTVSKLVKELFGNTPSQ
jgi:hypothetical protein